ncbi:E3 ubiquitin-protein ligase SINA-like 10 [Amborella trichopoda]|nr:E3 ubiquitin-protein ligase SINA-like 10 [Amborella trichopoda]|eukprot:XP_011623718.1 E3 ubiquitin-protein ligase SINA-like 10 [Amborella trichopoda]
MVKFSMEVASEPFPRKRRLSEISKETEDQFISSKPISVTIDPDIFDCAICMDPLSGHVYQCENGHIACSPCRHKLQNSCHSCFKPINNRCLAIEKVIDSMKILCKYACYGCTEMISFSHRNVHEENCPHLPYSCPVANCVFRGSSLHLSFHFNGEHKASARFFRYGEWFTLLLDKEEPIYVLNGENGLLFILDNRVECVGNVFSVMGFGPSSLEEEYGYGLTVRSGRRCLKLESFPRSERQRDNGLMDFLVIPLEAYCNKGQLKLEVCIWSLSNGKDSGV